MGFLLFIYFSTLFLLLTPFNQILLISFKESYLGLLGSIILLILDIVLLFCFFLGYYKKIPSFFARIAGFIFILSLGINSLLNFIIDKKEFAIIMILFSLILLYLLILKEENSS